MSVMFVQSSVHYHIPHSASQPVGAYLPTLFLQAEGVNQLNYM